MTRSTSSRGLLCLGILLTLAACSDSEPLTQIVVQVDSDWDGWSKADIDIGGFEKAAAVHVDASKKDAFPRRVTLVHEGGPLGPISVTVRATAKGDDKPSLIEPRTSVFFVRDKTRMLKIDLLFDCIGKCGAGQACIDTGGAEPECVESKDANGLEPWDDPGGLDPDHYGDVLGDDAGKDASVDAGGDGDHSDAGDSGGPDVVDDAGDAEIIDEPDASDSGKHVDKDADVDTGVPSKVVTFDYEPVNVDPESDAVTDLELVSVVLDCGTSKFNSSTLTFADWCGAEPSVMTLAQTGGPDAALIVMRSLDLAEGSTLALTGDRPVIILVYGDAHVAGVIDASAHGEKPGVGAYQSCGASAGGNGAEAVEVSTVLQGAGGGAGGGFGTAGGAGGPTGSSMTSAAAGQVSGDVTLSPLRGGCPGGAGGVGDESGTAKGGGGGGAIQISASALLDITGTISAAGGGGQALMVAYAGGSGGGSGGAILLEGAPVQVDDAAQVAANGGGGSGGQRASGTPASLAGDDGRSDADTAAGGDSTGSGGPGGAGAAATSQAQPGEVGSMLLDHRGGGGGGGGGVGRIRVNQVSGCGPSGGFSPAPSVDCDDCGACPLPPPVGCTPATHAGVLYYLCSSQVNWDAANTSCKNVGMDLVHIGSADENSWLKDAIGDESWIGANDIATDGDWRWSDDDVAFWSGEEDGAAVDDRYNAWTSSEPNGTNNIGVADCASIVSDGSWSDRQCSNSYEYVCE